MSAAVDGILIIDKPYGITSMEAVRRVKRGIGVKRVGHGGTLDPVATGVIPICIGQATRVMDYLISSSKEYRGEIELGVTTDTYDSLGKVTDRSDPSGLTESDLISALQSFKGVTKQVPPMYSALKKGGKRLYEFARAGVEVEREPRSVQVFNLELLDWSPPVASVEVTCGRGFYMRSLASDLGQALGCGAHLKSLVRLRSGPFHISGATTLCAAEESFAGGARESNVHALDEVLHGLRAVILGRRHSKMIHHGRPLPAIVPPPASRPGEQCRAYDADGNFLAILTFDADDGRWRPDKVFSLGGGDADGER